MVYPNPAGSSLHIQTDLVINRVRVFNSLGSIVSDLELNSLPFQLDLSPFESGVYTLFFYHENGDAKFHKKIVIQK